MLLESLLCLAAVVPSPADPTLADAPAAGPSRGGYWLSVELYGPAAARTAAIEALSEGLDPRAPRDRLPPGESVGYVAEIQPALAWLAAHAFAPTSTATAIEPRSLAQHPTAVVGGALHERFGVQLSAFIITGATPEGDTRTIDWPVDGAAILPTDSPWRGASLIPARAPMFAAPAATTPPASEAFATASRSGEVYVVEVLDRCDGRTPSPACMRWVRVVARDGDRFVPGYLPRYQVALRSDWVRGEGTLPRAQLIPAGLASGNALFVLLARARDNTLHLRTLSVPADEAFPAHTLTLEGDWATITFGDAAPIREALDATLDARVR